MSPNDDYFYQSIVNYINDEAADAILVDKLKMFLSDIQSYQQYSKDHPVYQLIDKFYNDHYVIQYLVDLLVDVDDVQTFMVYLIKLSSLRIRILEVYINLFVLSMN
ncbi:hypothetical protein ACVNPZ_10265 [Staphylococcus aureus]